MSGTTRAARIAPPPAVRGKVLPPPRYTGSSAAALLDAALALAFGICLWVEPPGGYYYPSFWGPESMATAVLPDWPPLDSWAVLFLVLAAVIICGRGAPRVRWALVVLAAAWATWAGGALYMGLTRSDTASTGGLLSAWVALVAWRDALALGRRA